MDSSHVLVVLEFGLRSSLTRIQMKHCNTINYYKLIHICSFCSCHSLVTGNHVLSCDFGIFGYKLKIIQVIRGNCLI